MSHDRNVPFGLGLEAGVNQVSEMLTHARMADDAGLDVFSIGDHPYFAAHAPQAVTKVAATPARVFPGQRLVAGCNNSPDV